MLTIKQILWRSARLFSYLTILNVVLSIIFSVYLSGNIFISFMTSHLGNLALIEAAIFFLIGGATDFLHTAKWYQARKYLNLSDQDWTVKATDKSRWIRLGRPQDKKLSERESTEWTVKESREGERKALVYLFVGIFLCLELAFLALTIDLV